MRGCRKLNLIQAPGGLSDLPWGFSRAERDCEPILDQHISPCNLCQAHKTVIENKSQAGRRKDCFLMVHGSNLNKKIIKISAVGQTLHICLKMISRRIFFSTSIGKSCLRWNVLIANPVILYKYQGLLSIFHKQRHYWLKLTVLKSYNV